MGGIPICANVSMLFTQLPLLDRIDAAARAGFDGVELWFPYDIPASSLASRLKEAGMPLKMINTPAGGPSHGERGCAAIPGRSAEFRAGLALALDYATTTGASFVHVMSGLLPEDADRASARDTLIENLAHASEAAMAADIVVVVEAINPRTMPGYFLNRVSLAVDVLRHVGAPNAGLLYDHFHADMIGEPVELDSIGSLLRHVQVASAPERAEPRHVSALLSLLHQARYRGWLSGEYSPAAGTLEGLAWMAEVRAWSPEGWPPAGRTV